MKLNKSTINQYIKCPYTVKLQEIDKISYPSNPAMQRGSNIHKAFETFFRYPEKMRIDKFKETEYYRTDMISALNFLNFNKLFEKNLYNELYIELATYNFKGTIDRIDRYKGDLCLIDYKSGREHSIEYYELELAFYSFLFEMRYGVPIKYWCIYFADTGNNLMVKRDSQKIVNTLNLALDIQNKINKNIFSKNKNAKCEWCNFYPNHCKGKNEKEI